MKPTNYTHLVRPKQTGPFKPDAIVVIPKGVKPKKFPYKGPAKTFEPPSFVQGGNQRGRVTLPEEQT